MVITFALRLFIIQIGFAAVSLLNYSCSSNQSCGCSLNSRVLTRIVGGEQAAPDAWNWAVSIRDGPDHICGGSLVASTLVLTAAHCLKSVKSFSTLTISIGSKFLSVIHQQRSVSHVYQPRNYSPFKTDNDIAVLRLSSPVDMTDRSTAYICLPLGRSRDYPPAETSVVAVGWGVPAYRSKTLSNELQQVALRTVSRTAVSCRAIASNPDAQLCAGVAGGGKDTCQGDSGGPLMAFSNGRWELVGITSYGSGCGSADYPGVYTRVAQYSHWFSCFLSNDTLCILNLTSKASFSYSFMGWANMYGNISRCVLSMTVLIFILV